MKSDLDELPFTDRFYIRLCRVSGKLNALGEKELKVSEELKDSLEVLRWPVSPREVGILARATLLFAFLALLAITIVWVIMGMNPYVLLVLLIVAPLLSAQIVSDYPKSAARRKVMNTLGFAPEIVTEIVVSLKQNPNLEEAVRFAAKHGKGEIAEDLKEILWNSWSGKKTSVKEQLPALAIKWGKYADGFKRSLYMIRSSFSERSEERRIKTLDRSLSVVLTSVMDKMRDYINALFLPTLILFTFGTVLPLMLVSLLPVVSYFGLFSASPLEILLVLMATVGAVYLYSNNILAKRPATFSPPKMPDKNKGRIVLTLRGRKISAPALAYSFVIFIVLAFPSILYLFTSSSVFGFVPDSPLTPVISVVNTLSILWGAGLGCALYLWGTSHRLKKERDETQKQGEEIVDATYQLASRLAEDRPPEEALVFTSKIMEKSSIGDLFRKIASKLRGRTSTIHEIVFCRRGFAEHIYSERVKSVLRILVVSIKKGSKASSEILFTTADYFSEMMKVEVDLKNMIQKSISMLRSTILFFAPMICGIVVTLYRIVRSGIYEAQARMSALEQPLASSFLVQSQNISPEILQLVVGIYMLTLSIVLSRFITIVESGDDRILRNLDLAKVVPISLLVFTLTLFLSQMVLM